MTEIAGWVSPKYAHYIIENLEIKVSDRLTPSINFQYAFLSLPAKRILWYIGH